MMPDYGPVIDKPQCNRFELLVEGQVAFAAYQLAPGRIIITHVETPAGLRGRGIASAVARGALAAARERGLAVTPRCGFMAAYIRRHPNEAELDE
jgi:predicted GNAT family acetyltransferase